MQSIDDLFNEFGGVSGIGRAIGKPTTHAGSMKRRRSVPLQYWGALIASERGREIGLTSDLLMSLHAGKVSEGAQ